MVSPTAACEEDKKTCGSVAVCSVAGISTSLGTKAQGHAFGRMRVGPFIDRDRASRPLADRPCQTL